MVFFIYRKKTKGRRPSSPAEDSALVLGNVKGTWQQLIVSLDSPTSCCDLPHRRHKSPDFLSAIDIIRLWLAFSHGFNTLAWLCTCTFRWWRKPLITFLFWRWFIKPFILIFQHDVNLNTKTGTKALPKTWFENLFLEFPASMLVLEVARARLSQPPSDVKIDDFSLSTDLNRGEKPLAVFCFFLAKTITAILCRSSSFRIRLIKMPKLICIRKSFAITSRGSRNQASRALPRSSDFSKRSEWEVLCLAWLKRGMPWKYMEKENHFNFTPLTLYLFNRKQKCCYHIPKRDSQSHIHVDAFRDMPSALWPRACQSQFPVDQLWGWTCS